MKSVIPLIIPRSIPADVVHFRGEITVHSLANAIRALVSMYTSLVPASAPISAPDLPVRQPQGDLLVFLERWAVREPAVPAVLTEILEVVEST